MLLVVAAVGGGVVVEEVGVVAGVVVEEVAEVEEVVAVPGKVAGVHRTEVPVAEVKVVHHTLYHMPGSPSEVCEELHHHPSD